MEAASAAEELQLVLGDRSIFHTFHGVDYQITPSIAETDQGLNLCIELEQLDNEDRWYGEFADTYVEQVCHKTGNFKKFGVFVRMLSSALDQENDSVFVDLLTYADLEAMQRRKQQQQQQQNGGAGGDSRKAQLKASAGQKRYLILTYATAFDRVHYPLPLVFQPTATPEQLQRTVARLRKELSGARHDSYDSGDGDGERSTYAGAHAGARGRGHTASELESLREQHLELRRAHEQARRELRQLKLGARTRTGTDEASVGKARTRGGVSGAKGNRGKENSVASAQAAQARPGFEHEIEQGTTAAAAVATDANVHVNKLSSDDAAALIARLRKRIHLLIPRLIILAFSEPPGPRRLPMVMTMLFLSV